ncbi:cob(I)yrinic acid a,c-diamide adenosyltransferase [Candidatus Woesearchaeota archaeon]|nr:cob(I)yrinic acid a,c-diamide adenosyltransferase [Candidatus Woesearchaeota archaeon]
MGKVYLWTGNGWGKTTSAIGAAVRAAGHGYKVTIIQFMKGRGEEIGEYRIRKKIGLKYEIRQFGRTGWINLKKPAKKDKELAEKGLKFAYSALKKKPFILVLDEINLAVRIGLLDEKEVLKLLNKIPEKTTVYLTGRQATAGLKKRADFVNEIRMIKGPKKIKGEKGIDY